MTRVVLLGATGSVGTSALAAIEAGGFELVGVAANSSVDELCAIAERHRPLMTVAADPACGPALKARLGPQGLATDAGADAMVALAAMDAERVIVAIPGFAALRPALAAIDAGRIVCLANKEVLVAAGEVAMARVRAAGATVLPVDSEHNAIFQVFERGALGAITRIVLTASGGPFREASLEAMRAAGPRQALKHPNWSMGAKISIDSATMMNKGLEVIEAHHLFPVGPDRIGVVVHPQSIIHGMVHYADGSCLAHMSNPSMVTPIAHCLHYPDRGAAPVPALDLVALGNLTFEAPDDARFPALRLASAALRAGTASTNALNAANEVAVASFLAEEIGFLDIAALVEATLDAMAGRSGAADSVDAVEAIDGEARRVAREKIPAMAGR
ncbi:1-deoxy-D-xylulose-5-phosphate reductoisomerase [Acuticoccus sp. MNP-M23]|uniref:1-deoxy-D-xylulose-5-phosphate reductoisomerase n=1 Tax=Acuticoccus sp. MNP-M23 TaxID=3072793 RepID=UPI0028169176|nr:1-deoxy-D-xylulose-5-phosphate reductoisomerase [Acuticoccus sp. MNP-M23]WMS41183.1 1-deoxy-D-xylulose-5-phosphate reductoisomerase [Acuticoccus sp. MNP-M23]